MARRLGGSRYSANSGGRVDVEGPAVVAQVKHVKTCSLASLEALAVEMDANRKEAGQAEPSRRQAARRARAADSPTHGAHRGLIPRHSGATHRPSQNCPDAIPCQSQSNPNPLKEWQA